MGYLALYRQWRPQNFATLVGQQPVKTALTNALDSGKIAHAYLFSGPRGTGKTSTARILAKALNCVQGPTANPCGHCSNCERIANGTSMDVFEIDAASNRGIDEIKALRDQLAFTPVESRYKVYIIDEVHMLTTEAFNALLKTLEEPPSHVVFVLATTDAHKIPVTIHSRCQRFDFKRVTIDEIVEHLGYVAKNSGIVADLEALRLIAVQAEGGMRDALSLLDQCSLMSKEVTSEIVRQILGLVGREALHDLALNIGKQNLPETLSQLNDILIQGKDAKQILAELADYFRAVLLYKVAPNFEDIYLTDTEIALKTCAELFSNERLLAAEERIHAAILELRGAIRSRITVEMCLIDLCRIEGSTIAALNARIVTLERKIAQGITITNASQKNTSQDISIEKVSKDLDFGKNISTASKTSTYQDNIVVKPKEKLVDINEKQSFINENTDISVKQYAGDFAKGEDYWQKTLELLKNEKQLAVVSCAKHGNVYSFVNQELQILFKADFLCKRINSDDYKKICEDALLRVARESIKLKAISEKNLKNNFSDTKIIKKNINVSDNTPISEIKDEKLTNDEIPENLRKAMSIFGGTIKKI